MKLGEAWVDLYEWVLKHSGDGFTPDLVLSKMEHLEEVYE